MTAILVTGATGGFGTILVKWLQENRVEQAWRSGRRQLADSDYVTCDLTDANATRSLIAKVRPRTIFHLAGDFTSSFDAGYSVNVLGARHVIEALIAEKIEARVVLIGSAAEYGVVSPDENPISEDHVLRPVSAYGVTKAWQTQLGVYFARNSAVEIVIARMFNLLAQRLSNRLFVGSVEAQIAACLSGDAAEITVGSLDAERDYVRVDQAIDQLSMIAAHGKSGEVYHVASGTPISMRALLHTMLSDAGLDPSIVREDAMEVGKRKHDVPVIFADMTKTRNLAIRSHG